MNVTPNLLVLTGNILRSVLVIISKNDLPAATRLGIIKLKNELNQVSIDTSIEGSLTKSMFAALSKKITEVQKEGMDDEEIIKRLQVVTIKMYEDIAVKMAAFRKPTIDVGNTYRKLEAVITELGTEGFDQLSGLTEHLEQIGNPFGDDLVLLQEYNRFIYAKRQLHIPDDQILQEVKTKLQTDMAAFQTQQKNVH